jgi:hypothetical protein
MRHHVSEERLSACGTLHAFDETVEMTLEQVLEKAGADSDPDVRIW